MGEFSDSLSEAALFIIEADPQAFTLRSSSDRVGAFTDIAANEDYSSTGMVPSIKATLLFAFESFTPPLRPGEPVLIDGKAYKIALVEKDAIAITLGLEDFPSYTAPVTVGADGSWVDGDGTVIVDGDGTTIVIG